MLQLQEIVNLDVHEAVVSMFRSHSFPMVSRVIPVIILLVSLFLFVFPLFSLGVVGVFIFLSLFFIGVLFLSRSIFNWLGTYCILTNRRLLCIQRTGFFKKQVHEILLENITELSYVTKGIMQVLFHFGNVRLALITARGEFIIPQIAKPQIILDILSRQASIVRKRKLSQNLQGSILPYVSRQEDMEEDIREDGVSTVGIINPIEREKDDF